MWKRSLALPVTLVAIALGFLFSLQIETHKSVSDAELINQQRMASMKNILANAQKENTRLKEDNKTLAAQLDKARKEGGINPKVLAELDQLKMMDGTMAVQGPGVQISIDDRQQDHKEVVPLSTEDLARIVNTLKFAGAEAISINNQRIVATTDIVLSGTSTILINRVPVSKASGLPYEINAIGDQATLVDYFSNLEGEILKLKGVTVSITRKVVGVPSYKGSYSFKQAKP
ncbi:DUF881 domain-containing protein [Paradesulfitobacterium ferrireducens]|uniref:DUF881 domain-containing protein n=1 Tax=Paradesulfitobacterium ferrireducens TaxID=2816476 RepID=UPI001A8CF30D|nr:DUF881 domain-containing protein [Paradesulfitobacterium ferrireducens]